MKISSAPRQSEILDKRKRRVAKIDEAIESLESAILTLRRAKKLTVSGKYVIVDIGGESVKLSMANGAPVLELPDSKPWHSKEHILKSRKSRRPIDFGYRVDESVETIKAIEENLKSDDQNNREFFERLDARLVKR